MGAMQDHRACIQSNKPRLYVGVLHSRAAPQYKPPAIQLTHEICTTATGDKALSLEQQNLGAMGAMQDHRVCIQSNKSRLANNGAYGAGANARDLL